MLLDFPSCCSGLGFRVEGLGFRVEGLGFEVLLPRNSQNHGSA